MTRLTEAKLGGYSLLSGTVAVAVAYASPGVAVGGIRGRRPGHRLSRSRCQPSAGRVPESRISARLSPFCDANRQ